MYSHKLISWLSRDQNVLYLSKNSNGIEPQEESLIAILARIWLIITLNDNFFYNISSGNRIVYSCMRCFGGF